MRVGDRGNIKSCHKQVCKKQHHFITIKEIFWGVSTTQSPKEFQTGVNSRARSLFTRVPTPEMVKS